MTHTHNGNCTLAAWDEEAGTLRKECPKHGQPTGKCKKCEPCLDCKPKRKKTTPVPGGYVREEDTWRHVPLPAPGRRIADEDINEMRRRIIG